jgi:hypothetical protein
MRELRERPDASLRKRRGRHDRERKHYHEQKPETPAYHVSAADLVFRRRSWTLPRRHQGACFEGTLVAALSQQREPFGRIDNFASENPSAYFTRNAGYRRPRRAQGSAPPMIVWGPWSATVRESHERWETSPYRRRLRTRPLAIGYELRGQSVIFSPKHDPAGALIDAEGAIRTRAAWLS